MTALEAFHTEGVDLISFRTGSTAPTPVPPFVLGTTDPATPGVVGPLHATTSTITPADLTGGSITKIYQTPGEVISNVRFEVWVDVRAAGVVFNECEFVGPTTWTTGRPLVRCTSSAVSTGVPQFRFCLFQPTTPGSAVDGVFGQWFTHRCRFRHCLDSWGAVNLLPPGLTNCLDEGSYANDHCYRSPEPTQSSNDTHNDGAQLHYEPRGVHFVGSRIEGLIDTSVSTYSAPTYNGSGVQQSGYKWYGLTNALADPATWTTSAVLSSKGTAYTVINDIVWDRCWLDGGEYGPINLGTWTTGSNVTVKGCRFGKKSRYGVAVIAKSTFPIIDGGGNTLNGAAITIPLTGSLTGVRMNG